MTARIDVGEKLATALTIRYALILAALAALAVGTTIVFDRLISSNTESAQLLNISGRQRMLSQRIAFWVDRLAERPVIDASRPEDALEELRHDVALMRQSHEILIAGDPAAGLSGAMSSPMKALFFGPDAFVDRNVREFLFHAEALVAAFGGGVGVSPDDEHLAHVLAVAPGALVADLDAVVRLHQSESEQHVSVLRRMHLGVLVLTLLVLAFSAVGIFHPMVRRIHRDLEERRRAVVALRESEHRYALATKGAHDGLWDWDIDADEIYLSPRLSEILGITVPEGRVPTSLVLGFIHPDDHASFKAAIRAHIKGFTEFFIAEFRLVDDHGDLRWILDRGIAERRADGRAYRMAGSFSDITERKRAEEQLRRNLKNQEIIGAIMRISLAHKALPEMLDEILGLVLNGHGLGLRSEGCIFLAEEETVAGSTETRKVLALAAQRGLAAPILSQCARIPFGYCLCGRAAGDGAMVHADSVDPRHEVIFAGMSLHGHYCAPIKSGSQILGVLNLYVAAGHQRNETEENFITTVADTLANIIRRLRTRQRLRELSQAVEQSPASVVITDAEGRIEYVNPKFVEVTGYSPEEAIGQTPNILKPGNMPEDMWAEMWTNLRAGREWRGELQNHRKNDETYWEVASISPIKAPEGTITHYLAVMEDITLRKEFEQKLLRQANYDDLTGLPNRLLALDRLSQALARAHRQGFQVALMFIDLDHFKKVNDTLGHAAGDSLLKVAAQRLTHCLRESDTVARLGGDEFTVILPDLEDAVDAEVVAEKILEACSRPFTIDGHDLFVTASIGITIYPNDEKDAHLLMRNADAAMYRAKEEGRGTFRFFTAEMNQRALAHMRLEAGLRHAIDNGELLLHFQPLVDIASGKPVGAEALVRWQSPTLGNVPPGTFIPVAEDTGLIVSIGEWVLCTACGEAARWQTRSEVPLYVAVNVSSRQFQRDGLAETVRRALAASGLPPQCLELEITENVLLEDSPETTRIIDELNTLGVRFSIDDFGTGYSSLSYLRRFPFDTLKIDRSFVKDVTTDLEAAELVRSIIAMAQSMDLKVIAEGVENHEQFEFLRRSGCDISQGWLFSKAVDADRFVDLLDTWMTSDQRRLA